MCIRDRNITDEDVIVCTLRLMGNFVIKLQRTIYNKNIVRRQTDEVKYNLSPK